MPGHGIKHGVVHAAVHGMKHNVSPFTSGIGSLATKDATSSIYIPQTGAEWAAAISALGLGSMTPASLYKCQEASGNLADSTGSNTLTALGTAAGYQTAVAGWASKAVSWTDGATTQFKNNTTVPNPNASSLALLTYQYVTSIPVATRVTSGFGVAVASFSEILITTGLSRCVGGTNVDGSNFTGGAVRPVFLVWNRAAGNTIRLYTNQDKLAPNTAALSGTAVGFGAYALTSPLGGCLYGALWTGVNAEFSDAQAKTLLSGLGYTIPWS